MEAREFAPGAWTLYLLADGSREFVREFLEELKSQRPQEYKKIVARCFFDGTRRIVLTHGFIKKQNRTDPEEIKRAVRLRDAYLPERASRRGRGS